MVIESTSPAIDWYVFDVHGTIVRVNGSTEGLTVVLLGRCGSRHWTQLGTCDGEGAEPYGPFDTEELSPAAGRLSLRVSVCGSGYPRCGDSLAVAVIYPDTMVVAPAFAFDSVKPTEIEKTGTEDVVYGCDKEYTFVDGHIYKYPAVTIPIP
jgi:hypothetical protein